MNFHKFFFLTGVKLRNPSLWKFYNELKQSEKWDTEKLKKYQSEKLFVFLEFAGTHSPYYKKLFNEIGWQPGMTFNETLFRQIPVLTKSTLITQNNDIHTTVPFSKLFHCETSGTSGQVLTFRRNEEWDSFNRASILRGYSWYGVNAWDYSIYFWGYSFSRFRKLKARFFDLLVNRYRIFSYSGKSKTRLLKKLNRAVYVEGYSSMIYELACLLETSKIAAPRLKLIKGTSEKIFPHYSEKTNRVFGKKIVSEYGAAETGIIAFECPAGRMHINMEGVIVETDENNEIIITNYHSRSFPIIRYKLGDAVMLDKENELCSCGMRHPVIEEVTGRIGNTIYGHFTDYPGLTFYYIFKNLYFEKGLKLNYQAHQHQRGNVELWLKEPFDNQQEQMVLDACEKYFGKDMTVTLYHHPDFRMTKGKLRDFIPMQNIQPLEEQSR